jgi:hypothetical protein
MRTSWLALLLIGAWACANDGLTSTDGEHRVGNGPALGANVGVRVITDSSGAQALYAFAAITNETTVHLGLAQCPLRVELFPDPTGEHPGRLDGTMACPSGSPVLDMAPGDSTMQSLVLTRDSLAAFASGQYNVEIVLTSSSALWGSPAGDIQLPLNPQ